MAKRITLATDKALAAANLNPSPGEAKGDFISRITSDARYAKEQRALALGIIATDQDPEARAPLITALKK